MSYIFYLVEYGYQRSSSYFLFLQWRLVLILMLSVDLGDEHCSQTGDCKISAVCRSSLLQINSNFLRLSVQCLEFIIPTFLSIKALRKLTIRFPDLKFEVWLELGVQNLLVYSVNEGRLRGTWTGPHIPDPHLLVP